MSEQDLTAPVEFRTIPRYVGYRFGSDGSVWSCWTKGCKPRMTDVWHQLTQTEVVLESGYRRYVVGVHDKVKPRIQHVSRLILEAFRGPCPPGMECCHDDGNSLNNCISNLRWDTPRNNAADKKRHGTEIFGVRHPLSRFTEEDVREARRMRSEGATIKVIAERFETGPSWVSQVCRRKIWPHI